MSKRVKIAYGCGRALGVKTLQWLCEQKDFEIVAVCPIPKKLDEDFNPLIMEIAHNNNLNVCDISELLNLNIDIGLSINYYKIIDRNVLQHCKKGFYNVHHSYNLRLRGRNITTYAIINTLNENIFYHGTTLHKMAPELDAGAIVASQSVEIENWDTAYSLFQKVDEAALILIKEWLPRIAFQKIFLYEPPKDSVHCYRNIDLPLRALTQENMSNIEIDTYIRAFDFPGYEPAFIEQGEKKIHLVYEPRDEFIFEYKIGDYTYYSDIKN